MAPIPSTAAHQRVVLLLEPGFYSIMVEGDVQAEVDRLARVADPVVPRFLLGNPTGSDWVPEPGVNNGGLRWLTVKVAELSEDYRRPG